MGAVLNDQQLVNLQSYKSGKDDLYTKYLINDLYNQVLHNINYIK
jgi:hypothetical protein